MEFHLVYKGRLKGQKPGKDHVFEVRREFHPQLKELWNQEPLKNLKKDSLSPTPTEGEISVLKRSGQFTFAPLACQGLALHAKLNILFLRPAPPGSLFDHGGDIDNRVKTLIDALRIPSEGEIPKDSKPEEGENPFFCLLEDDKLVTAFSVTTDRLLTAKQKNHQPQDCQIVIQVILKPWRGQWNNMGLA
ncbi:MAG: hypothetical protein IH886_01855 [Nitrospinae bacterium]|nr:hypothetical protein [Nitrospinota bacterium]